MHNTQKTHLVVGNKGQIGKALQSVLRCDGIDKGDHLPVNYDVLHIAIPYSATFDNVVNLYREEYNPKVVVIHSTVPVGTSFRLDAVHSPCRGIHPNLEDGIRTFVKFFGGKQAREAAEIFIHLGIPVRLTPLSDTTEAMKLWDTTIYGVNILLEKFIYKYCKENQLDFDVVYTEACRSYNEGYKALGKPEYSKYIISHQQGKLGGHCVSNNVQLIGGDAATLFNSMEEMLSVI